MIHLTENPRQLARKAGALYILIALIGPFAIAYVPSQIVTAGDAQATAEALMARSGLFRLGMAADFAVIGLEIVLTAMLYVLLRPVDAARSMAAALARFAMIAVMAVILLLNAAAVAISTGALSGSPETVLALLEVHAQGIFVWGVLFSLHLFLLGGLIRRSGYFPKWFGGAMVIGSFGYLIDGLAALMQVDILALDIVGGVLLAIATLGELGFALWLAIKGLDATKWADRAQINVQSEVKSIGSC